MFGSDPGRGRTRGAWADPAPDRREELGHFALMVVSVLVAVLLAFLVETDAAEPAVEEGAEATAPAALHPDLP